MSQVINYEVSDGGFRQNYVPASDVSSESRHWLLDYPAGRDLLVAKLLKTDPSAKSKFWGKDDSVDAALGEVLNELGLNDLTKPTGLVEQFKLNLKLFRLQVLVQFGRA